MTSPISSFELSLSPTSAISMSERRWKLLIKSKRAYFWIRFQQTLIGIEQLRFFGLNVSDYTHDKALKGLCVYVHVYSSDFYVNSGVFAQIIFVYDFVFIFEPLSLE